MKWKNADDIDTPYFVWRSFEAENCQKNMIDLNSNRNDAQWTLYTFDWNMLYVVVVTHSQSMFSLFFYCLTAYAIRNCYCCYLQAFYWANRKGPNPKQSRASFVDLYSFPLDPCHRSMCEIFVVHRFSVKIYSHDSTWHRHSHVTNKKRFRWLFWHPSCSLSQYKMQIQQNDTQEFFYKEKGQQLVCNANSNCDSLLLLCFSYFHQKLIAICQTKIWNKSFRMAFILSIEENKKGLLHWKWWHKTMRKKRNGWRWKKTWTNLLCYIAIFLFHIVARHSSSRQAFEGFIVVS